MKWAKAQLNKYRREPLPFDLELDIQAAALERFGNLILALPPLHVVGWVQMTENDDVILNATVTGEVTVPSARSLAPVLLPVDVQIDERYVAEESRLEAYEETDAVFVLTNDTLDLDDSVLDNVVANLPLQALTPAEENDDELPSGHDWVVLSETQAQQAERLAREAQAEQLDPRLSALDRFFDNEDK